MTAQINSDTYTGPSLPLSDRLKRLIWNAVWALLFRTSPRPFHRWRAMLLRLFGAKIGRGVHVYPSASIWAPWRIEIGDQSGVGDRVILYSQDFIRIGRRAVVSQGAHLCAGTHDYNAPGFPLITRPITIGDNVWIAAEVFIHPGVTVADGAVVGARSVVINNLPEWTVCSGFPCQPLKKRTSNE
ncbi:WcaF family extracellular polysaccharide biosynthesis acetyltransferase [Verrucomicrobiota bacterium sgz303538]